MPEAPGQYVLVTSVAQAVGNPAVHVYGPMTRSSARKAQEAYLAHPAVLANGDNVRTNICHLQEVDD